MELSVRFKMMKTPLQIVSISRKSQRHPTAAAESLVGEVRVLLHSLPDASTMEMLQVAAIQAEFLAAVNGVAEVVIQTLLNAPTLVIFQVTMIPVVL